MYQISKIIQHGYSTVANLQRYGQMLQKFYCFIFFFSLLSLHFFFSLLSHSLVPSLFSLYWFPLSSTSPRCSPATTTVQLRRRQRAPPPLINHARSHPRSISLMLSHARSCRSHPEATVDLTLFPLLFVHLSLCLSLVVGFFFWLQFGLI